MKRAYLISGAAFLGMVMVVAPVWAQSTPQQVGREGVDSQKPSSVLYADMTSWVSTAGISPASSHSARRSDRYRSSKIVGSPVVNDANKKIGTIENLIVEQKDKVLFVVMSVGGFLGIGEQLVVVPFRSLHFEGKSILLPGGSEEALKNMPPFKYAGE